MAIEYKSMKLRITFLQEILGTCPSDPELYGTYVASKAPDAMKMEEEIEAFGVDYVTEKGQTVFFRDKDNMPVLRDYQVRGFFKDTCGGLRRVKDSESAKLKAYKSVLDTQLVILPVTIPIHCDGSMATCQRPLRTSGPSGERTALANSESCPAGSYIDIELIYPAHGSITDAMVQEWLDNGMFRGIGQWRNSGKGSFTWVRLEDEQ